ncbi:MAG: hypothetical protein V4700_00180 [Pseudomonadota bacterium]
MVNTVMKLDTFACVKKLETVGVPATQAETHVGLISEIFQGMSSTEQTMRETEPKIKIKLKEIEIRLNAFELKIENRLNEFELKMENRLNEMENRLNEFELRMESRLNELALKIEQIKGTLNTQIAKWVLSTATAQAAIIIVCIRLMH